MYLQTSGSLAFSDLPLDAQPNVSLDRRQDARVCTVYRIAIVKRGDVVGFCRVRNISDGGMLIATHLPFRVGDSLDIQLSAAIEIRARVVRIDGPLCGLAFDESIDCIAVLRALAAERRSGNYRAARLPTCLDVTVHGEKGPVTVCLENLSQHGFGFSHNGEFRKGMAIKLQIADGDHRRGVVRWSFDGHAGALLIDPFTCEDIDNLVSARCTAGPDGGP